MKYTSFHQNVCFGSAYNAGLYACALVRGRHEICSPSVSTCYLSHTVTGRCHKTYIYVLLFSMTVAGCSIRKHRSGWLLNEDIIIIIRRSVNTAGIVSLFARAQ